MKWFQKLCIVLIYLGIFSLPVIAENQTQEANTSHTYAKKLQNILSGKVVLNETNLSKNIPIKKINLDTKSGIIPQSPPTLMSHNETNTKYQKSLQAYYAYKIRGFEHRSHVFEWQLFSSKLLFTVVLILVFSGVIFAGIQFYVGLQKESGGSPSNTNTEVSVSKEGFKISSPIIGLIVLALSLGFFYLYLIYVFPIEEIM